MWRSISALKTLRPYEKISVENVVCIMFIYYYVIYNVRGVDAVAAITTIIYYYYFIFTLGDLQSKSFLIKSNIVFFSKWEMFAYFGYSAPKLDCPIQNGIHGHVKYWYK